MSSMSFFTIDHIWFKWSIS